MFCFIFLLGHSILRTELMAGLCTALSYWQYKLCPIQWLTVLC